MFLRDNRPTIVLITSVQVHTVQAGLETEELSVDPTRRTVATSVGHKLGAGVEVLHNPDTQVVVGHVHYCVQVGTTDTGLCVELCHRGGGGVSVAIVETEG